MKTEEPREKVVNNGAYHGAGEVTGTEQEQEARR